ncbi:MAG: archaetidylserine decarboxylase [bacterium]|nr:archaetidylserine decarboxylase [bacterium]
MVFVYSILARFTGFFARLERPHFLVRTLIHLFVRLYRVDITQLSQPLSSFPSLLSFFIREPAQNSRPIAPQPNLIIAPVDAFVTATGLVLHDSLLLVKGRPTSFSNLLGTNAPDYLEGIFLSFYLSPRDIHRIYSPCDAIVTRCWTIPGSLFPVSPAAARKRPNVLLRNRRTVTELSAPWGKFLMIKVGAANVGRIVTKHPLDPQPSPPVAYRKGDELGRFELGSTVILVFQPHRVALLSHITQGFRVLIGQPIARVLCNSPSPSTP